MFAKSGDLTSSTADKHNNNFETYMKIRISIGKYPLIIYIFFSFRKVSQQRNQIRPQIARTRMETKLKSHAHLLRHPKKSWNRRRRQNETAKFRQ